MNRPENFIMHTSLLQPSISANSCKNSEVKCMTEAATLTTAKTICQMKLNTNRSKGNNRRTMGSNWKNKNHQPQQPTTTNNNEHNSPKSMHENGGNYNNEPQLQDATTVQQP